MRILVTNDDGIHAPGLAAAERIAGALSDDVWVVAPETDQSGVAHSLTLSDPLRLREVGERRFAVRGTPTDCVIMGVKGVLDRRPDLVLSGVNRGQNIADDVTYSGTVAGAIEGSLLGIRSFALSQAFGPGTREKVPYETAVRHGPEVIRKVLDGGADAGLLFNVNFPDRSPDGVAGVEVVRQGKRTAEWLKIDRRIDGRGNPYYWIGFEAHGTVPLDDTDMAALAAGRIAVTPLHVDLTDDRRVAHLRKIFG